MQVEETRNLSLLPTRVRGNYSSKFQNQSLVSNHYKVNIKKIERIVVFKVKFQPQIPADNRKQRQEIFKNISQDIKSMIKSPVISGMNIYSVQEGIQREKSFKSGHYIVTIKQVKVFDLVNNPKLLTIFLNNGLRRTMEQLDYCQLGKTGKFFNNREHQKIDSIMMYNGFKANFVLLQGGNYLRVDSAKKIVRNQTVLEHINKFYQMHQGKQKQQKRNLLKNQLVGQTVMANYGKCRYLRISDVHFVKIEDIRLDNDGMSLKQYYRQKYQTQIKHMNQPLLLIEQTNSRPNTNKPPRGPNYIVPQLCLMTGIPEDFDENRRRSISTHTIKNPKQKLKQISGLMEKLKSDSQFRRLKDLGIQINSQLKNVNAKQIPVPTLLLGGNNSVEKGKQSFFNLFNKPIYQAKYSIKLGVVFITGTNVGACLQTFNKTAPNLGVDLKITKYQTNRKDYKQLIGCVQRASSDQCNICLIILPNNLKNNYKDIKYQTIRKQRMITQCMTQAKLSNKNAQSIATKILLQIIAKRGNTLWVPEVDRNIKQTMLLGFDNAKLGDQTVISASATLSSTFSSIYTVCQKYSKQDQKFTTLLKLTLKCIQAYQKRNDKVPRDVLIGINSSAGDVVRMYHDQYCLPIINQVRSIYNKQIGISLIMVNLKTSQRFFASSNGYTNNPPAGTLVSQDLVSPNYDFYIISQMSSKGTSVPNHYKIIFNSSKMEEGMIQDLLFGQCFNYVNWSGSIKVPSVMQYAKKHVKFLSEVMPKANLREDIPDDLCGKLYFV